MEENILKLFKEIQNKFSALREQIGNYLQSKTGIVLSELPADFARIRWRANSETKRVTLDLYVTGKIVCDFQTKLSSTEKTSLDTSQDFLELDMEPGIDNHFDLSTPGQLDKLAEKIREHFNAVTA